MLDLTLLYLVSIILFGVCDHSRPFQNHFTFARHGEVIPLHSRPRHVREVYGQRRRVRAVRLASHHPDQTSIRSREHFLRPNKHYRSVFCCDILNPTRPSLRDTVQQHNTAVRLRSELVLACANLRARAFDALSPVYAVVSSAGTNSNYGSTTKSVTVPS